MCVSLTDTDTHQLNLTVIAITALSQRKFSKLLCKVHWHEINYNTQSYQTSPWIV